MRCNERKYMRYERNIEHKIRFPSINLNFLGQIISISELKRYFGMILMDVSVQKAEGGGRESDAEAFKRDVSR